MTGVSVPMWTKTNSFIPLIDVIELFDEKSFTWVVLSFDGSGTYPKGLNWAEFQDEVDLGKAHLTWASIQEFASSLDQMYEGEIVAYTAIGEPPVIEIEIFDSTEYNLTVNNSEIDEARLHSGICAIISRS
ncbi:hypothetical protein NRB20_38060 [Nocardia sp. RB20]|uniref:Uncharacterized protein n=2 Tax=Nocardia macrotermitis TaxID=2585198 RepID=A0A7K0D4Q8_9NOCA|nr:hypothetical protein [Nocardia macrotermitis]